MLFKLHRGGNTEVRILQPATTAFFSVSSCSIRKSKNKTNQKLERDEIYARNKLVNDLIKARILSKKKNLIPFYVRHEFKMRIFTIVCTANGKYSIKPTKIRLRKFQKTIKTVCEDKPRNLSANTSGENKVPIYRYDDLEDKKKIDTDFTTIVNLSGYPDRKRKVPRKYIRF